MRFSKTKKPLDVRGGGSVLLASLLLVGCGLLDSRKTDYRAVKPGKPLDVPPELSAPAKDDRYTVSEASSKGTTFSSYNAERAALKATATPVESEAKVVPLATSNDKLRIERSGNQRWLVMPGTPAQIWPQLKRFVESRGLVVKSESPELGLLETEWAEKAVYVPEAGIRGQLARALGSLYSTSERDKYRIRIEAGKEPGTTEVFVSHRGVEEVFVSADHLETRWQPRPNDPELEAELLVRLVRFVGVDEAKAGAIVAASKVAAAPGDRARLVDSDNKLQVIVEERFDRAWRRVGLALDRNGFTVEDRDRANGLYYVRYVDPLADKSAASKSWLASLAFWKDEDAAAEPVPTTFRIAVVGVGDDSARVEVQDKGGVPMANASARRILEIVRQELK